MLPPVGAIKITYKFQCPALDESRALSYDSSKEGDRANEERAFLWTGAGFSIFFLSRQKENAGKRKRRPGDFEFPPDPLKRPGKPFWFSWTFPAPGSGLVEPTTEIAHRGKRDGTQAVPYAEIWIFTENSEHFRRGRPMCRPDVRTQANPYQFSNFIGSRLPRRLKHDDYRS